MYVKIFSNGKTYKTPDLLGVEKKEVEKVLNDVGKDGLRYFVIPLIDGSRLLMGKDAINSAHFIIYD